MKCAKEPECKRTKVGGYKILKKKRRSAAEKKRDRIASYFELINDSRKCIQR
jgi:hypothetical protein